MSFLMPFFLWLLPFTAIPFIIHLLNRRNIITIEFSTLRFFKILEKESIRKLKLLQLIILTLRTIIILLIIIMITRPVITGTFSLQNSGQSALHAIILDDSFSMQGNSDIIKRTANDILEQIPTKGQLIWLNVNKGIQYKGLKENMPALVNLLSYTHLSGTVTDGLNLLRENIDNKYTSIEVNILTDGQQESIEDLLKYSDQYQDMNFYTMLIPQLNDNLAIINVKLVSEILLPNHSISLEVSVKNTGTSYKEDILLQLIIDNMSVGQQLVSLPSGSKQTLLFKTALPTPGLHQAIVELGTDDKEADNRYFFNLYMPDQRKIAIINNVQEDSYYIHASMEAINKPGLSLTIFEYLSLEDISIKLENYDVVFIIPPSILTTVIDSEIEEYLYNGGHIILLPNDTSKSTDYAVVNSLSTDIVGNYLNMPFLDLSGNSFQDIDLSSIKIGEIYNLFFSAMGQDRNIRLFNTFPYLMIQSILNYC